MDKLFKLIIGAGVIAAGVLYMVTLKQEDSDKKQSYEKIGIQKNISEFKEEFATEKMIHADSKKEEKIYEKQADKYGLEVAQIELKREAAEVKKREAEARAEQAMKKMDSVVANIDDSDFNF